MPVSIWQVAAGLGVGAFFGALFYAISVRFGRHKGEGFETAKLGPQATAIIATLIVLIAGAATIVALVLYQPQAQLHATDGELPEASKKITEKNRTTRELPSNTQTVSVLQPTTDPLEDTPSPNHKSEMAEARPDAAATTVKPAESPPSTKTSTDSEIAETLSERVTNIDPSDLGVRPNRLPAHYTRFSQRIIASDLTIPSLTPVLFETEVLVPEGVSLTIESGVTVYFASGHRAGLRVEGNLDVDGSADSMVLFTSDSATPAQADWMGILVLGTAKLNSAIVEYASTGVSLGRGGNPVRTNSNVSGCEFRFNSTGIFALSENSNSLISISDSKFYENRIGINVRDGAANITGNSIYANVVGVYGGDDSLRLVLTRNLIYRNKRGLEFVQGRSGLTISLNTIIQNSEFGLQIGQNISSPRIRSNNFIGNGMDIIVISGWRSLKTIDARQNYWGTANPDDIEAKITDRMDNFELSRVDFEDVAIAPVVSAPNPDVLPKK